MRRRVRKFRPFPLLGNPHVQTILGSQLRWSRAPASSRSLVLLDDGDRIAIEVSTPPEWTPRERTVLLIHGLCGCQDSGYLVRLSRRLFAAGIRAVRMNQRGCGSGAGLARNLYHSGRSEDVEAVLRHLRRETPDSPLDVVGFSLGGNMALKLAGELGDAMTDLCDQVVAICPPANLLACAHRLSQPHARIYDQYFVRLLRRMVADRHERFPDLGPFELPPRLSLYEFDDLYTAPHSGFASALDYYTRSSSAPLTPNVRVRCRVLFAEDDPFIDPEALAPFPSRVEVLRVSHGGHLGFVGAPGRRFRWMDECVLGWLSVGDSRN